MSHTQYASLRQTLPAPTIAAVSGGNLTGSGTIELAMQGRNRAGWNLPTSLQSVSYTAGQRIAITIPSTARAAGEDIHEWVISIAATPATPNSARQVAIVQAYDPDQITQRSLPATIYLSEPEHIVVGSGQQVPTLAALPVSDGLINGMVREVLNIGDSTSRILEYREESTATANSDTVFSAATGRWHSIAGFSTYITDTLAAGGCDRALSALDLDKVLQPPPYLVATTGPVGSVGTFVRYWFFGSRVAGGPATAQGTRVGLRVFDGGLDRSASFDGLLQYIFHGYVDPADGTRDTSGMTTGAQQTYTYGKSGAHLLEKDLPAGEAAEIAVAPRFTLAEQPSLTQGTVLSVGLRAYTQAGSLNPLPGFFGNAIAPEGDRLRVVPDGGGVKVLGGSAAVGTLAFPLVGEQQVVGLDDDTAGQYIHVNGNGIAYVDDGNPGPQEAIRAKVSTAEGRSSAGVAASYVAVTSGDTLVVTVTHGRAVRSNYPEPSGATSVIAGNSDGTFNPPQLAVYLERESDGEIWEYLATVTDTATQDVAIASLASADAMPASIPTAPAANFSLFGPGAASFTSPSGSSDLTAGNYRVSFAYVYDGGQVTAIQHEAESPAGDWLKEIAVPLTELGAAVGGGAGSITGGPDDPTVAPPTIDPNNDGAAELYVQSGATPTLFIGLDSTGAIGYNGWGKVLIDVEGDAPASGYGAYAARLTGTYSGPELAAIEALFTALAGRTIAAGGSQLDSLQLLTLISLDDVADAPLNLKGTDYTLDFTNAGAFTAREGVAVTGGQTFTTGFIPSVASASFDGVFGFYLRDATGAGNAGGELNGSFSGIYLYLSGSSFIGMYCDSTGVTQASLTPATNQQGAVTISRAGLDVLLSQNQNSNTITLANDSLSFSPTNALILGDTSVDGSVGVSGEPFQNTFAAVWAGAGKGWTEAETEAFHADIETCLDALGAGVIT